MKVIPVKVKRRNAFIDELCLLKDIDEYEAEYLRETAEQGARVFWEALHRVCGRRSAEYMLQIAEKNVEMAEFVYTEMEGKLGELFMDWGDIAQAMIQWYMISTCAQELAKYESRELYDRVTICVEQTKGYLESVIRNRAGGLIREEGNLH